VNPPAPIPAMCVKKVNGVYLIFLSTSREIYLWIRLGLDVKWKKKAQTERDKKTATCVCDCTSNLWETYVLLLLYWAAVPMTHWVMRLTMASSDWPWAVSCLGHLLAAVWFPACSVCSCPAGLSQKRPPEREEIGVGILQHKISKVTDLSI